MALTDRAIKALKPGPKARKVADGNGLFLLVNASGSKWWRLRFYFRGIEKMISLGTYPDTGLALARARSCHRCLSENAVLAGLRRLGYEKGSVTGHGFRATARTMLDEVLGEPIHLIEHQLVHKVKDPLGRAYNRTQHLKERARTISIYSTRCPSKLGRRSTRLALKFRSHIERSSSLMGTSPANRSVVSGKRDARFSLGRRHPE
jgi:hypothetical protein